MGAGIFIKGVNVAKASSVFCKLSQMSSACGGSIDHDEPIALGEKRLYFIGHDGKMTKYFVHFLYRSVIPKECATREQKNGQQAQILVAKPKQAALRQMAI